MKINKIFSLIRFMCLITAILYSATFASSISILPNTPSSKTVTFYSQMSDGEVLKINCSNWDACRNGSIGSGSYIPLHESTVQGAFYNSTFHIKRTIFFFNTASIPANAIIESAVLNVYTGPFQTGNTKMHVVSSTANIPLTASDFSRVSFVSGGSASSLINSWMQIPLSPIAFDWVIKGGITKLALVHDYDLENLEPTAINSVAMSMAESQYPPFLTVTYSATGPDMKIDAIEITQAIQNLNNSVDLIANKRTYVRVHVSSPTAINGVTATLTGERDGTTLNPVLVPRNPGTDINIDTVSNRGQIDDSFWFELPSSWLNAGELTLTAHIDPADEANDPDLSNNSMSVTKNLLTTPPLRLRLLNVPYEVGGVKYQADSFHFSMLESWLRRAYPISDLQVVRTVFAYVESGVPDPSLLLTRLETARLMDMVFSGVDSRTVYYGMVDDGGGPPIRGRASSNVANGPTGTNSLGWDFDGSYGDWYGGHEIAHTKGRYDIDNSNCNDNNATLYPYPDGRISLNLTGNTALYGFDINNQTVYPPDWHDVMTYCINQWISDITYKGIRDYMVEMEQAQVSIWSPAAVSDEFLVITGMIDLETNVGEFDSVYIIQETSDIPLPEAGDWEIALQDATGTDLTTYPFAPQVLTDAEESTGRPAIFAMAVPTVEGLAQLVVRYQDNVIDERIMSENAPSVTITAPQPGQELGSGSFTFAWTGSDLDGDLLKYSVLYSFDNGATWQTIATGLETEILNLDVNLLSGSNESLLRVVASDGFLSSEDISGPFTVPMHAPGVNIISPAANSYFWPSQLIVFRGEAYDLEDGQLTGAAIEWSSNLDGFLGHGTTIDSTELSIGQHIITLRVADSDGLISEAQKTITVLTENGFQVYLPIVYR